MTRAAWFVWGWLALACRAATPQASLDTGTQNSPAPALPGVAAPASSAAPASNGERPPLEEEETVDDDPEDAEDASDERAEVRPHPLDGVSETELARLTAEQPDQLGSISLGQPSSGLLLNGVQATETSYYKVVDPSGAFGTSETLEYLKVALVKVHEQFPGTAPLSLGHISSSRGGRLRPHISHQSGRDVDIGFYFLENQHWYRRGTATNLDRARNWAFVRALITETDVEMILVDRSIQAVLREYARAKGEDEAWLESVFRGGAGLRPIIRHAPGHATHFHIRFYNPIAQETARRVYRYLVERGAVPPVHDYLRVRAKRGDTLGKLAKRYGTSVEAIKRANRLRRSLIREKQVYLIPTGRTRPKPPPARLTFPPRRLPPPKAP